MTLATWNVGDKVKRRTNVYNKKSSWRRGEVVAVQDNGAGETIYDVEWQSTGGKPHSPVTSTGYFGHGLTADD